MEWPKSLTLGALLGPPWSVLEEYQKLQGPLHSPAGPVEAHQTDHTLASIPGECTPIEIVKISSSFHMWIFLNRCKNLVDRCHLKYIFFFLNITSVTIYFCFGYLCKLHTWWVSNHTTIFHLIACVLYKLTVPHTEIMLSVCSFREHSDGRSTKTKRKMSGPQLIKIKVIVIFNGTLDLDKINLDKNNLDKIFLSYIFIMTILWFI